jgi:hypothetical protein
MLQGSSSRAQSAWELVTGLLCEDSGFAGKQHSRGATTTPLPSDSQSADYYVWMVELLPRFP